MSRTRGAFIPIFMCVRPGGFFSPSQRTILGAAALEITVERNASDILYRCGTVQLDKGDSPFEVRVQYY